jgi:3-deoxy-D-manno-octulosonate 8-phosphate phosphatase (KDO 8-P phosphatase)
MSEAVVEHRLRQIRALALDVDGVLTDGGLWWGANGEELKRFCFADIMGISLGRRAGLKIGLISGEDSPLVDRYARKMNLEFVVKSCRDKAAALREFATTAGIDLAAICYMGDDVNDLAPMEIAGLSAAPANAASIARAAAQFVTTRSGGDGALRELVEAILAAQQLEIREVFTRQPVNMPDHPENPRLKS